MLNINHAFKATFEIDIALNKSWSTVKCYSFKPGDICQSSYLVVIEGLH